MDFKYLFLACSCAVLVSCSGSSTPNEPLAEITDKDAAVNEANEVAEIGDTVGVTAEALDPDESDTVSYSLSDNAGGIFAIDAGSGVVTVAAKLDFEAATSHSISVLATSSDETTSSADFTINVLDNLPPVISISYPMTGIYNGDTISSYGTVTDPEGDAISVQVTSSMGSIDAVLGSGDSWRADNVSIEAALETIIVSAVDASGEVATSVNVELRNELVLFQSWGMGVDLSNKVVYIGESNSLLYSVNLVDGSKTLVSGGGVGSGSSLGGVHGVAYDDVNSRVITVDWSNDRIFAIDPMTGDRTILSSNSVGTGAFVAPWALALDMANNMAYVGDSGSLVKVDLANGNKTIVSDNTSAGTGPLLYSPRWIDLDMANNTAYVSANQSGRNSHSEKVYSINLITGDRVLLSDNFTGSGVAIDSSQGIAHDKANGRVIVADPVNVALYAINIADGARTLLSDNNSSMGEVFHSPTGLAFDSSSNTLYSSDSIEDGIFAIDASDGERTVVSTSSIGAGEHFLGVEDVIIDHANNRMIAVDTWRPTRFTYRGSVVAIDLTTAERTIISNETIGTGLTLLQPRHLVLDSTNNRVIVSDQDQRAMLAVDLATGNRTELSGPNVGTGDAIANPTGLDFDEENNRLIYLDFSALRVVDLANGNRTIISDSSTGLGTDLAGPLDVIYDADNNRSFVIDSSVDAVFSVDMLNGDRSILSKNPIGTGLNFNYTTELDWNKEEQLLYVMDTNSRRLFKVDIATGDRDAFSDGSAGQGEKFLSPHGVVYDSVFKRIFATDFYHGAIFLIDPETGDRIIQSK